MNWFYFSLAAAFFLGVGQVFIKKGYTHFSPLWNIIIDAIFSIAIYVPLALYLGIHLQFHYSYFFIIAGVTALYAVFYYAIEKGQISLSGTVFASYPIFTILLSYIFLHERISLLQQILILLILLGGILLSYEPGTWKKIKKKANKKWMLWALFGAVATGVGDFLAKFTLNDIDTNTYVFLFAIGFVISSTFFWIIDKNGRKLPKKINFTNLKWTLFGTLMLSLGVLSITYAFSLGKASLVTVTSSGYIGITVLLAYFFLHDKISRVQLLGIVLMFLGVAFIGIK